MKQLLLIICLLFAGLKTVWSHPIKMTSGRLSYDPKNGYTLLINFFKDDFTAHLEKIYHQRNLSLGNPDENQKAMLSAYVNKKMLIKLNHKVVQLQLQGAKLIEDNVVQLRFDLVWDKKIPVKMLEITNALLFDAFPEQANTMQIDIPGKMETSVFQFIPTDNYRAVTLKP